MDIVSRPSEPPVPKPLVFREIRVPLPLTLGFVFGGLAVGAWLLRPDFRFMASGSAGPAESFQVVAFLVVVAVALSAAATLLVNYGIRLLTLQKPHVLAPSLNKIYWGEAKEELSPARGRNSAPAWRWLFLCGVAGLQVLLLFAKGLFFPSHHWLWWGASVSGFVLGAVAAYEAAHRWRFSRSVFRMQSEFGVIGGTLQGCVFLRPGLAPKRGFRVRLRAVDTLHSPRSGEPVWLDEAVIVAPLPEEGGGSAIPVYFEIPDHCPPSGRADSDKYIDWYVEVSADTPAINCRIAFEVPVAHAEKTTRRPSSSSRAPLAEFEREVDGSRLYDNPGLRMRTLPGGDTEYYFPGRPTLGLSLFYLLVMVVLGLHGPALCFLVKVAFALKDPALPGLEHWRPWLVVPTACILAAAHYLYHLRSTRIQTGPTGLLLIESRLGFRKRRFFDADGISSIDLYWNMLFEDVLYYDLVLKTTPGKKVLLVTGLRGKPESQWLMEEMRRELFPPITTFERRRQELERFAKAGPYQISPWISGPVEATAADAPLVK